MAQTETYLLPANTAAGTYSTGAGTWTKNGSSTGLLGGIYALAIVLETATSVQLWAMGPDGSTHLNVGASQTSNAFVQPLYLPPGNYGVTIAGGTAAVSLSRVPS
jgi:hypothetical protein